MSAYTPGHFTVFPAVIVLLDYLCKDAQARMCAHAHKHTHEWRACNMQWHQ